MYGSVYNSVYSTICEGFKTEQTEGEIKKNNEIKEVTLFATIVSVIVMILIFLIQLFVVKWLWNTVFVRILSFARPIPSLLYTLGLLVLIGMLFPSAILA